MPFSARNARYLRVSAHTVLPLYIYLDDKHIEWMTDYTLQRVLEDLRPVIGSKLRAESSTTPASARKGTVDVRRGDSYQFAYFFRKNEPHDVLIKSRKFVPVSTNVQDKAIAAVEPEPPSAAPSSSKTQKAAGQTGGPSSAAKSAGTKRKKSAVLRSEHGLEDGAVETPGDTSGAEGPRRSGRTKNANARGYLASDGDEDDDDDAMDDSEYDPADPASVDDQTPEEARTIAPPALGESHGTGVPDTESRPGVSSVFDMDADEEEEKPKMSMRVSYQGFAIHGRCLCIVVEPWPPLHGPSRAHAAVPPPARNTNTGVSDASAPHPRGRTPLFLPDTDPRRSLTPAPMPARFLHAVPPHGDSGAEQPENQEAASDDGGMMAFSQVLKSVGDDRTGAADDDENEGEVFLGDADERKGDR